MPRFGLFLLFNVVALSTANDTKSYSQLPPDLQINQTLLKYVSADAKLTTPELITKYGYPVEVHEAVTSDGYILTMHRIPHGISSQSSPNKPIVFLQHGILSSSADWVITGPEMAFGYILADEGYDVWMGNFRGNTYSKRHLNLSVDDGKFWDFTWHEMGLNDLPAMIDYVLEQTEQQKLYYIGHSQGTTTFYVMASSKPEYNDKIRAAFSLAPIAFMNHMTSPLLQIIARARSGISFILNMLGVREFLPSNEIMKQAGETFCNDDSYSQFLCTNAIFLLCGFNKENLNTTLLPVIMAHTPAGASTKQLLHYAQEIESGKFRQFDYGLIRNIIKYKQLTPPNYDLSKVTAPVALHYSDNDWLSHPNDVYRLSKELGNTIGRFGSPDNKFNHLDYLWGINARENVYTTVVRLMKRY